MTWFHSFFIHSSIAVQPFVGPWPLLLFRNLSYTDGRTPWTSGQPPTHRATQTQNKRTQTPLLWVGFEPTITVFVRPKTVHALDRAAILIGSMTCEIYQERTLALVVSDFDYDTILLSSIFSTLYFSKFNHNFTHAHNTLKTTRNMDSSVGIATAYGLEGPGFNTRQIQRIFLFSTASRPVLEPTKSRI
jgi:hypothetical protein